MSTSTRPSNNSRAVSTEYGFFTDIEPDTVPRGLNEDVIRLISAKKQRAGVAAATGA